jgi:putative ABC transport system substrate-binding protein
MGIQGPETGRRDEARSVGRARPVRLLVVDDEHRFATLLGELLEARGYAVDIATSGEEALRLFDHTVHAAILLDVVMPGMDGIEVFDAIRRTDAAIPIIVVSGPSNQDLARTMLHRGAFDYMRKPIDVDHLAVIVGVATGTLWHTSGEAPDAQAGSDASPLARLPYAVVGLVRHLSGSGRAGREQLEMLAIAALREAQRGRQRDAVDKLLGIRDRLDAGRFDWLSPPDAKALRDILAALDTPAKVYYIGCVSAGPLAPRAQEWNAFRNGLRELGWIDGRNIRLDVRAPDREGAPSDDLVGDLVRLGADVIVGSTRATIQAAQRATATIPIVSTGTSLARPDRNVTGVTVMAGALNEERLQLLTEMVPGLSRVALLVPDRHAPSLPDVLHVIEAGGRALGMEVVVLEAPGDAALEEAFDTAADRRVGGVIVLVDEAFVGLGARIADVAMIRRIPTISGFPGFADVGGLAAYGPNATARYRQAAGYVDKILRGATPAQLPMEQPTKRDLFVNLKTATALGLTIPRALLLRADRVVE